MRRILKPLSLLALLASSIPATALTLTPKAQDSLGHLYAMMLYKNALFAQIPQIQPDLAAKAAQVDAEFQRHFPQAMQQLDILIMQSGDAKENAALNAEATKIAQTQASLDVKNPAIASGFVAYIDALNHGSPTPQPDIQAALLSMTYEGHPEREIADGFVQHYEDAKQGLKLELPLSWLMNKQENGDVMWISEYGSGWQLFQLMVDTRKESYSQAQLRQAISDPSLQKLKSTGTNILAKGEYTPNNKLGIWLETTHADAKPSRAYQHTLFFSVYAKPLSINMVCTLGGPIDKSNQIDADFVQFKPLCQQMVDSLSVSGR